VIRLYELEDESYYVVRRVDGTPLAVPARMTRPEAAHANVVSTARLPVRVLLELRRLTVTCLFSPVQNVEEGDYDATATSRTPKTTLRRSSRRSDSATSTRRQQQLRHAMVQWTQALTKMSREEESNEQDHR
jgi:hypothetical protein